MKNKKASHKPKAKRASQVNKENVDPRSQQNTDDLDDDETKFSAEFREFYPANHSNAFFSGSQNPATCSTTQSTNEMTNPFS